MVVQLLNSNKKEFKARGSFSTLPLSHCGIRKKVCGEHRGR